MPYARPSLSQLVRRAVGDISGRTKGSAFVRRSVERVLANTVAALTNGLHGHFEWLARQSLPTTAEIESLLGWGEWLKTSRKGAVRSAGRATFAGTPGTVVPIYTSLQTTDGLQFFTIDDATTQTTGFVELVIQSEAGGADSNLEADTPISLVSPIAGVDSSGVVTQALTGGQDTEDVEDYRARVLDDLRQPPAGGGPGDYRRWALEVEGVTRAWEVGNRMGYGTVSVAFVIDGRTDITPAAADIAKVADRIESRRPIDVRQVYVSAPIVQVVHVDVTISPDTADVRAAIVSSLRTLFRNSELETPIQESQVREAISTAAGEVSHQLLSVSAPGLDPVRWGVLALGTVTFR